MNRDRLLEGDIATKFLAAVLDQPAVKKLLSTDHFSVGGTLTEAWASLMGVRPKAGDNGRWPIIEADIWDCDYRDFCGAATITIGAENQGEIAFRAMQSTVDSRHWLQRVDGLLHVGWLFQDGRSHRKVNVELLDDRFFAINFACHNHYEVVFKVKRDISSTVLLDS